MLVGFDLLSFLVQGRGPREVVAGTGLWWVAMQVGDVPGDANPLGVHPGTVANAEARERSLSAARGRARNRIGPSRRISR